MKTRRLGIRERNRRLFLFWFIVFILFVILLCLCTCGTPKRVIVYETDRMERAIKQQAKKEHEFISQLQKGDLRSFEPQVLSLGSLTLSDLTHAKNLEKSVSAFKPIPGIVSPDSFQYFEQKESLPSEQLNNRSAVKTYIESNIASGKELISWVFPLIHVDASADKAKKKEHSRTSDGYKVAFECMNDIQTGREHLFRLSDPSSFNLYKYTENIKYENTGRVRVSVTYTDLARMLLIHLNRVGSTTGQVKSVNGSQELTTAMLAAYQVLRRAVDIELSAPPHAWEADAQNQLTEYAKALRLHDFLCRMVTYTPMMVAADNESLVVSAVLSQGATSAGYARTYMLLLTIAGIENIYVNGKKRLNGENLTNHYWNMARLDGKWVHIDVSRSDMVPLTFVGADSSSHSLVSHTAFAMTDSRMRTSLRLSESEWLRIQKTLMLEKADDEAMYYYNRPMLQIAGTSGMRSRRFITAEELAEVLFKRAASGIYSDEYLVSGISLADVQEQLVEQHKLQKSELRFEVHTTTPDENGVRFITMAVQD